MTGPAAIEKKQHQIIVSGELNFSTVPDLQKKSELLFEDEKTLDIDLSGITGSNSAGLALLIEWIRYSKKQNKPISLHHIPEQLMSIAKVSGVSAIIATVSE